MIKINGVSVKNEDFMEGRDGYIYRGELLFCGKKACEYFNDGHGGGIEFYNKNEMLFNMAVEKVYEIYKEKKLCSWEITPEIALELFVEELLNLENYLSFLKKRLSAEEKKITVPFYLILEDKKSYKSFNLGFEKKGEVIAKITTTFSKRNYDFSVKS